jgi:hypothetical protein
VPKDAQLRKMVDAYIQGPAPAAPPPAPGQ